MGVAFVVMPIAHVFQFLIFNLKQRFIPGNYTTSITLNDFDKIDNKDENLELVRECTKQKEFTT